MTRKKWGIDEGLLKRGANKLNTEDLKMAAEKAEDLSTKINKNTLQKVKDDILILSSLIKDYISGSYRAVPWKTIAMSGFTLLYVLNPLDIIPDFIPVAGLADDLTMVLLCLKIIGGDIEEYRQWKNSDPKTDGEISDKGEQVQAA